MNHQIPSLRDPATKSALLDWLPAQRWFDGTGHALSSVSVLRTHVFSAAPSRLGVLAVVQARDVLGTDAGRYLLVLGVGSHRPSPATIIAETGDDCAVHDGLEDPDLVDALVRRICDHTTRDGVRFVAEPTGFVLPATPLTLRPLRAEQSNTSVVLDNRYILKVFRRLSETASPDLVLHRLLRDAGSTHVPELLGAIEEEATGATLATLQRFLPDAEDGWSVALDSVRASLAGGARHPMEGDFTASARALGQALGDVHRTLAAARAQAPMGSRDCRQLSELFAERLARAVNAVPQVAPHAGHLQAVFHTVASLTSNQRPAQLTHGDLHLGQTLRTDRGWLLLDFEGEPQAAPEEWIRPHSPMRDVAGMFRSFDYAAHHELGGPAASPVRQAVAERWVQRSQEAFLSGYTAVTGPCTPAELRLLRAYELDKAVYEALYETQHRPAWAWIPLQSLGRRLRSAAA